MFTFTQKKDIEWAYDVFETASEAMEAGKLYFGEHELILVGEIGDDNKVNIV